MRERIEPDRQKIPKKTDRRSQKSSTIGKRSGPLSIIQVRMTAPGVHAIGRPWTRNTRQYEEHSRVQKLKLENSLCKYHVENIECIWRLWHQGEERGIVLFFFGFLYLNPSSLKSTLSVSNTSSSGSCWSLTSCKSYRFLQPHISTPFSEIVNLPAQDQVNPFSPQTSTQRINAASLGFCTYLCDHHDDMEWSGVEWSNIRGHIELWGNNILRQGSVTSCDQIRDAIERGTAATDITSQPLVLVHDTVAYIHTYTWTGMFINQLSFWICLTEII